MKRSPMRRRGGKQTARNLEANRNMKAQFESWGIRSCELQYMDIGRGPHEPCTVDNYLSWAHARKRRNTSDAELETTAILCCQNDHWTLERRGEEYQRPIIEGVIAARMERLGL